MVGSKRPGKVLEKIRTRARQAHEPSESDRPWSAQRELIAVEGWLTRVLEKIGRDFFCGRCGRRG